MQCRHALLSMLLFCVACAYASTPTFDSSPDVTPNPGQIGMVLTFSTAASETPPATLVYVWDFGDGMNATGATVMHAYLTAGIFNARVTITDPNGGSISETVPVTVTESGTPGAGSVTKASGKMYKSQTAKDSLSFSGVLQNVPADGSPAGQTVKLNVGGVISTFVIGANGKGTSAAGTLSFKVSKNFSGGDIPYTVSLKKQTFLPAFTQLGFDPNSAFAQGLSIPVLLTVGTSSGAQHRSRTKVDEFYIRVNLAIILLKVFWDFRFSP